MVGCLNEVQLRRQFRKSLDPQISFVVGYFNEINAFLLYTICFYKTVHDKCCLQKTFGKLKMA